MTDAYAAFLAARSQRGTNDGFDPVWMPDFLFDFQQSLVTWSLQKGRSAIFADCGLGKTPMQLVWAQNVVQHTNRPVLIVTPLAVSAQTIREGEKFGIPVRRSMDGSIAPGLNVTNYEKLHKFNPADVVGVVCDESSAIKHFAGSRQKEVTRFLAHLPYRLLCTATAAPNDYIELGTAAEALGHLGRMDMLSTFFKNDENSLHPIWWGARWRLKPHAEAHFWRWVTSWARAVRTPSDLGFADRGFVLPPLHMTETIIKNTEPLPGMLFVVPAVTLDAQRAERRQTLTQRCEAVAEKIAAHGDISLAWCHLNTEGDLLTRMIPGAVQVSGNDTDEAKEERFLAFAEGQIPCLVSKPVIGGFGLNFQRCAHQTFFPSHSFEQFYQAVRRSYRFGQTRRVQVDIVTTGGEAGVLKNLQRKAQQADAMFSRLVADMNHELALSRSSYQSLNVEVPSWLLPSPTKC